MSSLTRPTGPPSVHASTNASMQTFGPDPTNPVMVIRPRARRRMTSKHKFTGQVQTKITEAACKPSESQRLRELDLLVRGLAVTHQKALLSEHESRTGQAVWRGIVGVEVDRYCDENGASVVVCHTLPDYKQTVAKRPEWMIERGVERKDFAQYSLESPTAPDSSTAEVNTASDRATSQGYHDSRCGRYYDFKTKGTYTASDPGDDVNDYSKEDEGTSLNIEDSRFWESD